MKVKVIERFNDLEANVIREVGDEFDVTKTRFKEMKKYVEEVKPKKAPTKKKGD